LREIEEVFPYREFREHQRELINFLRDLFVEEKIGLVYAPTGLGKTIAALTAHLVEPSDRLIVVTRTKNQLAIYAKELGMLRRKVGDITYVFFRSKQELCSIARRTKLGKLPYAVFVRICEKLKREGKCPYYANSVRDGEPTSELLNVSRHLAEVGATSQRVIRAGERRKLCPYELAKHAGKPSNIVVGTYPYMFVPRIRDMFLTSLEERLEDIRLVVDEAHNLPGFIESQNVRAINLGSTATIIKNIKGMFSEGGLVEALENAERLIGDLRERLRMHDSGSRMFYVDISDIIAGVDAETLERLSELSYVLLSEDPEASMTLSRLVDFIEYFQSHYTGEKHVTVGINLHNKELGSHYVIRLHMLDPSNEARNVLKRVKSAVLMSGSLHPLEYYRVMLALSEGGIYERTETAVFPSPFPKDTLRVYVDMTLCSKYEERTPEMMEMYAKRISLIVREAPEDTGILVVFPSYSLQLSVAQRISIKRPIIIEDAETRVSDVKRKLSAEPNTVILCVAGGKLAEGIDYRIGGRTMIRIAIVAGLPFPRYGLILRKKQEYYEEKFGERNIAIFLTSIAPMVRATIQVAGRLIRDRKDRGVIFILDRRYPKYSAYFPRRPWQLYEPYRTDSHLRAILQKVCVFLGKYSERSEHLESISGFIGH